MTIVVIVAPARTDGVAPVVYDSALGDLGEGAIGFVAKEGVILIAIGHEQIQIVIAVDVNPIAACRPPAVRQHDFGKRLTVHHEDRQPSHHQQKQVVCDASAHLGIGFVSP